MIYIKNMLSIQDKTLCLIKNESVFQRIVFIIIYFALIILVFVIVYLYIK